MKQGKNFFCILAVTVVMSVCFSNLTAGSSEATKDAGQSDRKVVAKVNSQPIYEDQLEPYVKKRLKTFKKYGPDKESPALIKRLRMKALEAVIANELINQESRKLVIEDIDKKVQEKFIDVKKKYPSEEHFEKYLKSKNMTEADLRKSLEKSIYHEEYLRRNGISDPEIPDEQIRKFYDSGKKSFKREESVKVSHILIMAGDDAKPEDKEKALKKAERIRKELLEGKDFAEMAVEQSDCNSASGGGDLGYIKKGYMPKEFEEVAFTMEKGSISEVVRTRYGYHIIKAFEKKPGGTAPYEDVKEFIKRYLQEQESKKKRALHVNELREKAKIEILLNES